MNTEPCPRCGFKLQALGAINPFLGIACSLERESHCEPIRYQMAMARLNHASDARPWEKLSNARRMTMIVHDKPFPKERVRLVPQNYGEGWMSQAAASLAETAILYGGTDPDTLELAIDIVKGKRALVTTEVLEKALLLIPKLRRPEVA